MRILYEVHQFRKNIELFILSLPGMLFFIVFSYIPMFGIIIAFKNYTYDKKIWGSDWVGFDNFKFFLGSQDAFRITRNTILYNLCFILAGTLIAVVIALMLNAMHRYSVKVFQTVLLMPYFLSWVVIGYVLYAFLNPDLGILNKLLTAAGGEPLNWYLESGYWPAIMLISNIWKNAGYNAIIFYTGLMGIDSTYYEAAYIDGASKLQQVLKISIPLIRPLIILITLLAIGRIFYSGFRTILLFTDEFRTIV